MYSDIFEASCGAIRIEFANFVKNECKMEAYKFATTVLENGIIKIPELKGYANQKVEVFVVLNPKKIIKPRNKAIDDFFVKWAGIFSVVQTDDIKYNYLIEKYR